MTIWSPAPAPQQLSNNTAHQIGTTSHLFMPASWRTAASACRMGSRVVESPCRTFLAQTPSSEETRKMAIRPRTSTRAPILQGTWGPFFNALGITVEENFVA
jgi:hypothetical protein